MIDYLNPHHVYIDAHNAPDMSAEVKRDVAQDAGDMAETGTEKGGRIMDNRINQQYGAPDETPAERIIRLYRSGMSHVDIAGRGYDLAEVRRAISEGTRDDEKLYQVHKEGLA